MNVPRMIYDLDVLWLTTPFDRFLNVALKMFCSRRFRILNFRKRRPVLYI